MHISEILFIYHWIKLSSSIDRLLIPFFVIIYCEEWILLFYGNHGKVQLTHHYRVSLRKNNHFEKENTMNRISIPSTDQIPDASHTFLDAVHRQLGVVPNLMKLIAHSPAALEGYLSLNGALGKGTIGVKTSDRIALAIAEINGCSYCLSAHTYLGKNVAKLDDAELLANRNGTSSDPQASAAVHFATRVALERGHVSDADVLAVKEAGYSDAEVVEIVLHVALNTLTNYVNEVAQTEIDFPLVRPSSRTVG